MRTFEFQLQLPDGSVVEEHAAAPSWAVAFAEACVKAERHHRLGPWAGIRCRAYSSHPSADHKESQVEFDAAGSVHVDPWTSFAAA